MAASDLKANFQNQLKEIDQKIEQIQLELLKAKEYKIKLQGGLETLELLENEEPEYRIPDGMIEGPDGPIANGREIPENNKQPDIVAEE